MSGFDPGIVADWPAASGPVTAEEGWPLGAGYKADLSGALRWA